MAHKLLSELEADPNAPNAAGVSPLGAVIAYLAEENLSDALGMIHLLANKGAKIDVAITEGKTVHATVALAATLSKGVAAPAIEALLQHKADPNLTTYRFVSGADYDGVNYPVAIAAENGDVAAFNLLARNKANLNLPSALMYNAVATGDVRMIEAALSMSVNINAVHKKTGYTGLCRAVAASDVNTVRELLERKASPTIASPLHVLTKKAQYFKDEEPAARIAMGKMLIVAGADVNEDFSQKTEWQSWADYTPMTMLFGTRLDYSELIAFMIQRGAKIERVSPRDGRTPIMIAIDALKPQYVKMLLDAGADYESVDYSGFTPKLHIAKIKAGTPRSYRDEMKTRLAGLVSGLPNTLFQAVQKGTIENVSSAVQRSMDGRHPSIDTYRDPDSGNNALMEAVALGKVEMVEYLISYGAAVNEANRKTRATPLEIALQHNKASVIEAVQKEVQFQQWLHTRDHLPTELTCPITQQIMYVPVHIPIRTNGRKQNSATFEASAIGKWLFTHDALPTDGIRGAKMTDLVLNESVQEKIKQLRVNWEASQYSQDA